MSATRRISSFTARTSTPNHDGLDHQKNEEKKEIWTSMLHNVSSGKKLPEKTVLILGGSPTTQRDFLDSLSIDSTSRRRPPDKLKQPPIANHFALGYTYHDVLDADLEDVVARMSLYLLSDPSPAFTPLLKPLLTPRTLPHMLVIILLDWNQPWLWSKQVRAWVRVLRSFIQSLDVESKDILEENIHSLQRRGRANASDGTQSTLPDGDTEIRLGAGEWDEPLGIPLTVVCQNADAIERLEREQKWNDQFDFILTYLRTVLLKHGASLIYTMPSAAGPLQDLIRVSLDIQTSSSKRDQLKANHTDRDRIFIPLNWDSWGKIRVVSGDFDLEKVNEAWSTDIQVPKDLTKNGSNGESEAHSGLAVQTEAEEAEEGTAVALYQDQIKDPSKDPSSGSHTASSRTPGIEVETLNTQEFLTAQLEVLEKYRDEDEKEKKEKEARRPGGPGAAAAQPHNELAGDMVEKHIGRVQINMGGIQVDADDMVRGLKQERETNGGTRSPSPQKRQPLQKDAATPGAGGEAEDLDKLKSFFAKLGQTPGRSPSPSSSPRH